MREGALVIRRARGRGLVVEAAAGCSVQAGGQAAERQTGRSGPYGGSRREFPVGGEYVCGEGGYLLLSWYAGMLGAAASVVDLLVVTACWDRGAL